MSGCLGTRCACRYESREAADGLQQQGPVQLCSNSGQKHGEAVHHAGDQLVALASLFILGQGQRNLNASPCQTTVLLIKIV
jgi:hypothetical protein